MLIRGQHNMFNQTKCSSPHEGADANDICHSHSVRCTATRLSIQPVKFTPAETITLVLSCFAVFVFAVFSYLQFCWNIYCNYNKGKGKGKGRPTLICIAPHCTNPWSAQIWITVVKLQSTPYLHLPRSSPEGATTEWTVIACLLYTSPSPRD